jgi:tRNA modification GTPase
LSHFLAADGRWLGHRGRGLYFPAPASFTGEHVLELQGHGGAIVLDLLMQRCSRSAAARRCRANSASAPS